MSTSKYHTCQEIVPTPPASSSLSLRRHFLAAAAAAWASTPTTGISCRAAVLPGIAFDPRTQTALISCPAPFPIFTAGLPAISLGASVRGTFFASKRLNGEVRTFRFALGLVDERQELGGHGRHGRPLQRAIAAQRMIKAFANVAGLDSLREVGCVDSQNTESAAFLGWLGDGGGEYPNDMGSEKENSGAELHFLRIALEKSQRDPSVEMGKLQYLT